MSPRIPPLMPLLAALAAVQFLSPAQPAPPHPQDPLMNLMLSQPKIEISSNVVATAVFEPAAIAPGQEAIYRVTFNALDESISWPAALTISPDTELRIGGHGEIFQMGNGMLQPHTSFLYHVRPQQEGQFTIPEFTVKAYDQPVTVPAARLEVTPSLRPSGAWIPRLVLEMPTTNLFAGQPVRSRILLPGQPGGSLQGLSQVQFIGQGFIIDQSSVRQRFESRPGNGGNVANYIYEATLTPLTAGKVPVFAQGFAVGNRLVVVSPGTPGAPQPMVPQYTLLDSEPVELAVKPLPRRGELPGFTGAIGNFAVEPPRLPTNTLILGNPVRLTLVVHGDENSGRVIAPPPPQSADWQVTAAPAENAPPSPPSAQTHSQRPGTKISDLSVSTTFNYTLVPLKVGPVMTPAILFSYFDPLLATYVDASFPAFPVTVIAGNTAADAEVFRRADSAELPAEPELKLSDLAPTAGRTTSSLVPTQQRQWFPLLQLAPAAGFLALWGWDRRRRYLEQHPGLVLRRRALRALRRERRGLEQAARAGDGSRFANKAVAALRVACAPHYPADPRALVGADVLNLLPETQRKSRAGEVVRRFFATTDAARFATTSPDAAGLLGLGHELDAVLEELEEKLRA